MKNIDQSYLYNLVVKTRNGSSNAFAELFTAVYQRHYIYLAFMLEDDGLVISYMKEIYVQVLQNIMALKEPALFMPWSCRICYRACNTRNGRLDMDKIVQTPAGSVTLSQLFQLPLRESQCLIMRFDQGISIKGISYTLNFEKEAVKACIRSGLRHLRRTPGKKEEVEKEEEKALQQTNEEWHKGEDMESEKDGVLGGKLPDIVTIQEILDYVYKNCGRKPNTIPLEALSAYTVYRKQRFRLQKAVLVIALIAFLMMPLLFILPKFEVSAIPLGDRGLPVYTIDVAPGLPVNRVLAEINGKSLPVYEADAFKYKVEPIGNGPMTLEVELINRQKATQEIDVSDVDASGPQLTDSRIEDDKVVLVVEDQGIGIDYTEIYALDEEGNLHEPLSVNKDTGEVVFSFPESAWDVYIPDHVGNQLHLAFSFE